MRKISLSKKDKSLSLKTKIILIICAAVVLLIGGATFIFLSTYHIYETNVIKPTCESNGYTESICIYCKEIQRTHYTAALGHNYGEYVLKSKPSELKFGEKVKTCERCNVQEVARLEPTSDMKKLYFEGDAFNVSSNRIGSGVATYSYKGESQKYYIKLAYLETNSSRYIKHDYRFTFYKDKDLTEEVELKLMDSAPASSSWELYGNYYDFYNLRDTVATEIFKNVRASSKSIDKRLSPKFVTADDEPILFFMNNGLVGMFRLSEPEGANTLNVDEDDEMCAIVRANSNSYQSYFKGKTGETGSWRVKYNYTDDNEWIYTSLNELIDFVYEAEGEEFKKGISNYLDVDGMIDYMVTVYNLAAANNVGRCFTLATYDGKVWTPSIYDADQSFGLDNKGEITNLETVLAPSVREDGTYDPDCDSLLWEKMLNNFYDEIKARYTSLKDSVFTAENIYNVFEKHLSKVPNSVYEAEKELYSDVDSETDLKHSISEFMAVRKNILDVFFE